MHIPEGTRRVSLYLDVGAADQLKLLALAERTSVNRLINEAVERLLAARQKKHGELRLTITKRKEVSR